MSAAVGSAKKGNAVNEANEALYDAYLGVNPPGSEYFADVPWPEWSDAELNADVWEEGKSKPTTKSASVPVPAPDVFFEVDTELELPIEMGDSLFSWKRPHEVFPNVVLTLFDPSNGDFELKMPSPAGQCNFLSCFMEELPILQHYALNYGFPVECETPTFVPTTQGEIWRPWHHIYASCKAGKGQVHKPVYSRYGKYVLRLFYMGAWRRIVVDDKIPCDESDLCMLPVTQVPGELWPIILAKGFLSIVALTPNFDCSAIDLPFLSLFTGWVRGTIIAVNKTPDQIWRRLKSLAPSYDLPGEEAEPKTAATSVKDRSKKETKMEDKKREPTTETNCFIMATLKRFSEEGTLSGGYVTGISMVRDLPLVKANPREATKKWKRIRWIYWASEKGLWTDELKVRPYRRIQSISFVPELNEFLTPDPNEEATIYDIPVDDDAATNIDSEVFQPEQWSDFVKFQEVLLVLDVFLRPSAFPSCFRVTSLKAPPPGKVKESSATAKTAPKPAPQNSVYFFPGLFNTCNEPNLLYCEAPTNIFLSISLWVCPSGAKELEGYMEFGHPRFFKIYHASLIVERFDWRTVGQGEIIGMIKTVGNSSIGLHLRPGRHLLKLWLDSDSPLVMDIFSNVEVTLHKGYKVRFMMNTESVEICNYINNVSNSFLNVAQKFGKPDLPVALKDFYKIIMPGNEGMVGYKNKLDEFIETFINCIFLILKGLVQSKDDLKIMLGSLRSLFFNPDIEGDLPNDGPSSIYGTGKKSVKKVVTPVKERTLSEILAYPWSAEEISQVILIQKVFRGFRVRLLWKSQVPGRKEFKPYTDRLKKICDVLFAPPKREVEVGKLIRQVIMINPELHTTFKFYRDFPNVIQVDQFTGKVANVEPHAWIPIARFIVACHCEELVPCAFYLSCNLEQFVVQGVDNDTNEEIFRLTNSVSPHYYQSNVKGYTILIFGWNEANPKTVNWRLEMVRMKHFQPIHLCNTLLNAPCTPYAMPSLDVVELKNFYVPNHRSRVCRCLIKIQKRTLLTLRLSASYSDVQFVLTVLLDKRFCMTESEYDVPDKVITQVYSSRGTVMLSSVILEPFELSPMWGDSDVDTTVYILEAFVLHNSWPLTKQEWGVVEPIRVNGESLKDSLMSLQSRRESRKRLTRTSRRSLWEQRPVENPFWLLQILSDSTDRPGSADAMTVEEDKSYAESVKAMKIDWEEKNPGRRKKGQDLRMDFLSKIFQERKDQMNEVEGVFEETERDSDEEYLGDFKTLLQRMTSFSYLTENTSPRRLSKSPRVLPPMPTVDLFNKYRKPNPATTSESFLSDATDGSYTKRDIVEEIKEDRKEYLDLCLHYRLVLVNHLAEEQNLSAKLMNQAYGERLKAVERMSR